MSKEREKTEPSSSKIEHRKLALRDSLKLIVPITSINQHVLFLEAYQTAAVSHGEAFSRLREIRERMDQQEPAIQNERAVSLVVNKNAVAVAHHQDALEEARAKLGLDEERDRLFNTLLKTISLKEGLKQFSKASFAIFGCRFDSVEQLGKVFPNVTAVELALLPFIEHTPNVFLLYGHKLDMNPMTRAYPGLELPADHRQLAPCLVGANPQGLIFATSAFDFNTVSKTLATDPYDYLGISGQREDMEVVPFKKEIQAVFDQLIPLVFTNNRLHERLWYEARSAALGIGFGRLAEQAYLKAFDVLPKRDAVTYSFQRSIDLLTPQQRALFEKERVTMEEILCKALIVDLGRDVLLRDDEVFSLVGILSKIPDSFTKDLPFNGYIQPYGTGIKLIDSAGSFLEWIPYNQFFLRQAVNNIYWESVDVGKMNSTVTDIFGQILTQAETQVLTEGMEKNGQLSGLEEIKLDLQLMYGINLNVIPRTNLAEIRNFKDALEFGLSGDSFIHRTNSKFTLEEAIEIDKTVRLLPREMLANVKTIKKYVATGMPLQAFLSGMQTEGQYSPARGGEITLYHSVGIIPWEARDHYRLRKMFTMLHEIGESIWTSLTTEEKGIWTMVSWQGEKPSELQAHFLTAYSREDEKEDFCEHFAAFVLHAEQFRQKGDQFLPLQRKYEFLASIFQGRTGKRIDYPNISPFSIEEIQGALEQAAKKLDLQEAVSASEEGILDAYEAAKKNISNVVSSHERLTEQSERRLEVAESDLEVMEKQLPYQDIDYESNSLTEVLGQFFAEDQASRIAGIVKPYFNKGNLGGVEEILRRFLTSEELAEAMEGFEELYDTYGDDLGED